MFNSMHSLIVNNSAKLLKHPIALMPFSVKQKLIQQLLNMQLQQALTEGELDFLEQKWLKIEVRDLELVWFVSLMDDELVVSRCEIPDVTFSGNMNDLILIATRKQDPDTLFFQRRLIIEGNTELGLQIKNLMDSLDFETMPKAIQKPLLTIADFIDR